MRTLILLLALGAITIVAAACTEDTGTVNGGVLRPGESVEATNKFGHVRITYVSARKRKFEFGKWSRVLAMRARGTPFQGRTGLYDPGSFFSFNQSPAIVAEESTVDVSDYKAAHALLDQSSQVMDWVYTPSGLIIGYGVSPNGVRVNVDLLQLRIGGKKPVDLGGARPGLIRLTKGR